MMRREKHTEGEEGGAGRKEYDKGNEEMRAEDENDAVEEAQEEVMDALTYAHASETSLRSFCCLLARGEQ